MDCPQCHKPEQELNFGYGLAGGGLGPYTYCPDCGIIVEKHQDPELEEPKNDPTRKD